MMITMAHDEHKQFLACLLLLLLVERVLGSKTHGSVTK
jgi:hypothetical protein